MDEATRARRAYEERDAAPPSVYSWDRPGYAFYVQDLEWEVLRAVRDAGATFTGAAVLEVGCGFGAILHRLSEFGAARAAGVDLTPSRVAEARRRYPALDVVVGDASALPYGDGEFDVVTQFVCLSSILDPAVRREAMAEMWRVARPGGLVLSHDLRRTPRAVQAAGRAHARLVPGAAAADAGTTVRPVTDGELRAAWPGVELRRVSLNLVLSLALAPRSVALARMARALPALRTHTLAVARKPA